jgi:hypothetical protein
MKISRKIKERIPMLSRASRLTPTQPNPTGTRQKSKHLSTRAVPSNPATKYYRYAVRRALKTNMPEIRIKVTFQARTLPGQPAGEEGNFACRCSKVGQRAREGSESVSALRGLVGRPFTKFKLPKRKPSTMANRVKQSLLTWTTGLSRGVRLA